MKEVNAISMIKDKQVADEIINLLLDRATQVDYVLELVATSFITVYEQLASKLHVAMAKAITKLLEYKQSRIDLSIDNISFAYSSDQLCKLTDEARISYMLDICNVAFPNGKLEGASQHSKKIYDDTLSVLKSILKSKKITSINQLFKDDWYKRRGDYITLLVNNNDLFGLENTINTVLN